MMSCNPWIWTAFGMSNMMSTWRRGREKPATLFHLMGNKTEMQLEFLVQIALFLIPAEGRNKSSKLLYLTSHHNRNRLEKEKSVIKLPVLLISGRAHLIR
jgi:hypothetical protein